MLPGMLLAFREGLEGALVVGILVGLVHKLEHPDCLRSVWLGAISAALLSLLIALGLMAVGAELEGTSEALFEGVTVLLAAAVLTWMIFWMQRQGRSVRQGLETRVRQAISGRPGRGLFLVAFLAVLREGIELALFLAAAAMASSARQTWVGGLLGLTLAIVAGWALFASVVHLDLRRFFQVTGVILLLFAAGLVARGIHEFVEIGWLPALLASLWNTGFVLSDQSTLGQVAGSLFGYRSSPSLAEVLGYTLYMAGVLALLWRAGRAASQPARRVTVSGS